MQANAGPGSRPAVSPAEGSIGPRRVWPPPGNPGAQNPQAAVFVDAKEALPCHSRTGRETGARCAGKRNFSAGAVFGQEPVPGSTSREVPIAIGNIFGEAMRGSSGPG